MKHHRWAQGLLGRGVPLNYEAAQSREENPESIMRRLAGRLTCDGLAQIGLSRGERRRLSGLLREAERLAACGDTADPALKRLAEQARLLENLAEQARREGGQRMPARSGAPRVAIIAFALLDGGERALSEQGLMAALRAFNAVRPLTQRELWAVPEALRAEIARACLHVADAILRSARLGGMANRWARNPSRLPAGRDDGFYEQALMAAGALELPEARAELEFRLRRMGKNPQELIRHAHEAQARSLMRLDNLSAARRVVDALDWQACFEALSSLEAELNRDPSGVYPLMDAASRQAVRDQVTDIALRLGVGELTVARRAVAAAREACEADETGCTLEALSGREWSEPAALRACVCYWLWDDAGRRALQRRMARPEVKLPRTIPDPHGRGTIAALAALTLALFALLAKWVDAPALWPLCLPLAWTSAQALVGRLFSRCFRPLRLLKLDAEAIPESWRTLVVTPVLLSDVERAETACEKLEALGCLDADENIEYLLLGDYADADEANMPGDGEILSHIRSRIARMNARAGHSRYHWLHRPRTLLEADRRYMGRDRKRGALMDLNRLLLGEAEAQRAFLPCEDLAALTGRFRYVVTLDADTRMLPGMVHRLVGAMAHPLNRPMKGRGWAVMQPRMELMPSACVNAFARLFSGAGGVDTYPVTASGLWMDLTGNGVYAGKGIYDVAAFQAALQGALPEGRILSHDLIEGAVARAAALGDVALYDGSPTTLAGWMRRLHRWTRGDWQLLPLLTRCGALPNGRRIAGADRFRMADNLIRSLRAPALLAWFGAAVYRGDGGLLAAGMLLNYLEPLLSLAGDKRLWRRATAELATLPLTAYSALDAALRALWRTWISGRHMLDWVPSSEAEGRGALEALPGRIAAALLLPGVLIPGAAPMALALAGLFWVGADWVRGMEAEPFEPVSALSAAQRELLMGLARDTWRFFERCVPLGASALPPDNVQLDPPADAARRTSPTNIGLYMLSCASAMKLGLIRADELRARLSAALDALEGMEKWRGHLYNWIDIDALSALRPRYVSSVDSGNLAACAIACAGAVREMDAALSARLTALAEGMDFAALYDPERNLFHIGMDIEAGRLSQSHYDLLASEARTLSYVAIMLHQVPAKHWERLGRGCVPAGARAALLSWSGTMFEYLMPELLLRAPAGSLLSESIRGAAWLQRRYGEKTGRPWGVSESGYHAFDGRMNYQYRAFGLPALALGGAQAGVIAPYASALALAAYPAEAADNLGRMLELGWADECGLYEAADYRSGDGRGEPALVKSHMAHHQGMALCAICNALTGDALSRDFMADPRARAFGLLLEERPCSALGRSARQRREKAMDCPGIPVTNRVMRSEGRLADVHLLRGRDATVVVTADGGVHYARHGVDATRFSGDFVDRQDAACVHLLEVSSSTAAVMGGRGCRMDCDAGEARFTQSLGAITAQMRVSLSPEDDTLYRALRLQNRGSRPARLRVIDALPVALARAEDWRAHPAFQNMFVEAEAIGDIGLLHRRRPRNPGDTCPTLAHAAYAPGPVKWEASLENLLPRTGDMRRAEGLRHELTGTIGTALNPVSALCAEVEIAPGGEAKLHFAAKLLNGGEKIEAWLAHAAGMDQPERASRLNRARGEATLGYLGIGPGRCRRLDRLSALLLDGHLAARAKAWRGPEAKASRQALWSLGLSGDRPILALWVRDAAHAGAVRDMIRAHAFYRAMGIACDLALVDDCGGGYARPVRDMLAAMIEAHGLAGQLRSPGGAWLLEGDLMENAQRAALECAASLSLDSGVDFDAGLKALGSLEVKAAPAPGLDIGPSALPPVERFMDNGYGGFGEGARYSIDVTPDRLPPAPWCNLLAGDQMGILLSERGGGFLWHGNSRSGRLTAWRGDALREGRGLMLWLRSAKTGAALPLLPGDVPGMPWRVTYTPRDIEYAFAAERLSGSAVFSVDADSDAVRIDLRLEGSMLKSGTWQVICLVDWLMGTDAKDATWLRTQAFGGVCLASGSMPGVGWLACDEPDAEPGPDRAAFFGSGDCALPAAWDALPHGSGYSLCVPCAADPEGKARLCLAVGWAESAEGAVDSSRRVFESAGQKPPIPKRDLVIRTPDAALNRMAAFLPHQVRAARVLGRTGLYQPGGAYGFRDQLQDMLALLPSEPGRVRAHLLMCAARQFESGDVLHWWHMPYAGVRTRISDDRLFLPWVTAAYVRSTGDSAVLEEVIPYLEEVPIPEDRADVYCDMRPGADRDTLHGHCMRAFQISDRTGERGLALMGAGDWNDGMNRVGAEGLGESVWLSEFLAACADSYSEIAPAADAAWLRALAERHRRAVESKGWDGAWFRRAYMDDGTPLGSAESAECRIDLIAQAWAVLAGLDAERCKSAMKAAWQELVDEERGIIRLLAPPFQGDGIDPGYIRGYPPGIRENGAQYTHGACWLLLALIRLGDSSRAHRALQMLLPPRHADTPEKVLRYRVEPYVTAADIYTLPGLEGRGGWTWYTGSAAWLYVCLLELLGFERRGDRVRLNALLGGWPEASVELPFGGAVYRLVCDSKCKRATLDGAPVQGDFIQMLDDGGAHEARFPARDQ